MLESTSSLSDRASGWESELGDLLEKVREDAFIGALILVGVVIAVLINTAGWRAFTGRSQWAAITLLVLAVGLWLLSQWDYLLATWLLVAGAVIGIVAFSAWLQVPHIVILLAVPVGLCTMTISRWAGLVIAVTSTFLILMTPASILPGNTELRTVALLAIWAVYGMVWLTLQPLITGLSWMWEGYELGRAATEQARDTQLQLNQTLEDLTKANVQLIRLNQRAHGLRQMAEDERRTKERFVANVSHELRTPLNMIIGFCEMITQSPETYGDSIPQILLADLQVVLRNSHHLSSLIDDVLDLSQIEAGQMALSRERVDLSDIVNAAAIAVRPLFESRRLYLTTLVPENLPEVYCDRTRIREVILNLLTNAGRFTESGGVELCVAVDDHSVVVAVKDTGPGISDEDQQRLFRPFGQLDAGIRHRYGGSGLGLAISKRFVEMHDGTMWVDSKLGEGTTFSFRLPLDMPVYLERGAASYLVPGWEFRQPTRHPQAPEPVVRPRLVITEHGEGMQRLLTRYLGEAEITSFEDLRSALQEIAEVPATALLINATPAEELALRSGVTAKLLPPGIPMIICSIPDFKQAADTAGQSEYLVKPVSREGLLNALDRLDTGVRTILVVDDEPDVLRLFSRILTESGRGYRALRASNGHQALSILRRERVDALILDLIMPEMDGFQFIAQKEADDELRDIPTIVVSAQDPMAQPITSDSLSVTCRDGLGVRQLLACIQSLTEILSTAAKPVGPEHAEVPRG